MSKKISVLDRAKTRLVEIEKELTKLAELEMEHRMLLMMLSAADKHSELMEKMSSPKKSSTQDSGEKYIMGEVSKQKTLGRLPDDE